MRDRAATQTGQEYGLTLSGHIRARGATYRNTAARYRPGEEDLIRTRQGGGRAGKAARARAGTARAVEPAVAKIDRDAQAAAERAEARAERRGEQAVARMQRREARRAAKRARA